MFPDIKCKLNYLCCKSASFEGVLWDTITLHMPPETFCEFTLVRVIVGWSGTNGGGGNKFKLVDGSERPRS